MKDLTLVTGASGAIGHTLVRTLLERGYRVRALVSERTTFQDLPEGVETFRADITDTATLREATRGVRQVFHLAAKLHVNNPGQKLRDEYTRVNVEGTRRLFEAAGEADVQRFVFFSTISVYGATQPGDVFDEETELRPDSLYAETKARAEEIVSGGMNAVVLRLAAVYGPRMKGNYPRLLDALRKRRLALVGDGRNGRTLVYVDDACRAAVLAAEHAGASGKTFNVTDGSVHTLGEIVNAMSDALGVAPPKIHIPKAPVRLAAGIVEDGFKLIGKKSPVGRELVDKFVEDVAVRGDRIQRELGFQPRFDLRRGWQETVERMRNADFGLRN